MLALDTHMMADPPHRRMIEQQRLGDPLQQDNQVIVAADMRQFVRHNRPQLLGTQSRNQSHG